MLTLNATTKSEKSTLKIVSTYSAKGQKRNIENSERKKRQLVYFGAEVFSDNQSSRG